MYCQKATIQDLLEECANIIMDNTEEYELFPKMHSHDKLFRDILENSEDFKSFICHFVSQKLEKVLENEEIESYNKRFIMTSYIGLESDIIFKVKNKPIYFLVEHQSKIDEDMSYRIFNYVTELIKEDRRNSKIEREYPQVIPVVLYTGDKKWKASRKYTDKSIRIEDYDKTNFDISYELVDINQYTIEELLKKKTMISYALMIEKTRNKDELLEVINKIGRVATKDDADYIIRIIKYLLNPTLEEEALEKLLQDFKEKGVIEMPNAFERILEQEKMQGKREGKADAKKQFVESMLLQGLTVETIAKYIGIPKKEVQRIKEESVC